ncbi:hypothetical protein BT96DRAFT_933489 [Gymnopus androsaceus JB14]|uniref:Uncharacterized protein n=1 Tax=Gymnopus androsaceus JB14 TaxID=1447944 RepID=A0A6A4ICV7_9AGAR|nr:hypothetical protein BT96DRAFT_933489 [Gymnopus androsaceus JB14]
MAIEGITTSWPYMSLIRSPPDGANFVNTLSPEIIELHCNWIVPFCKNLALHPEKVLDPNTPQIELNLDGQPFIDKTIIPALRTLAPELPNLNLMISAMFHGAAQGWKIFTSEYADDPLNPACIASLLPEQLALLGRICMTNDSNEGGLGSISTRKLDASGEAKRFQEEYLRLQKEWAELARKKVEDTARKKADELQWLSTIGIVVDQASIQKMTVAQLKDQFKQHKGIYKIMIKRAPQVHPWDLSKIYKKYVEILARLVNTVHH